MRRLCVLLVLGAATCQPTPEDTTPVPTEETQWLALGPVPEARVSTNKLGPVVPQTAAPLPTYPADSPAVGSALPVAPGRLAHTGAPPAPEPRRPQLWLAQDTVAPAHGARVLRYKAWPQPPDRPTLTIRFLAPEHVPAARRELGTACRGTKPRTLRVDGEAIDLNKAFPYKFGAACLDLAAKGYPTARAVVQSTDLAMNLRYDLDAVHVLVTSLRDGSAVQANLTLVDAGGKLLWSGKTDAAGYGIAPGLRPLRADTIGGPLTLFAGAGEDFASSALAAGDADGYLGAYAGLPLPTVLRPAASITAGRKYFRAGEDVVVQGIVRTASPTQIAVPGDAEVTWTATAFDGEPLVSSGTTTLRGGAFTANLSLPTGTAPGPLRLRFDVPGAGELGHTLQIVGPELSFDATVSGDGLHVALSATHEISATATVRAVPAIPTPVAGWQVGPADTGLFVPASAPRRASQPLGTPRTAQVHPDAPWAFDAPAPPGTGPWDVEVDVTVVDQVGQRLSLRDTRRIRPRATHGIAAPLAVPSGPCPEIRAVEFAEAGSRATTARIVGPDGRATDDCSQPGAYLASAGPNDDAARWFKVYDAALAPSSAEISRTGEGVLVGVPKAPWRGLLTLERGGILHAVALESTAPWLRVPLPDLARWAPNVTATVTIASTGAESPQTLRLPLVLDDASHTLPVSVTARATGGQVEGSVSTEAGASVQVLCVDAASAVDTPAIRQFWHPWSEGALSHLPRLNTQPPTASVPADSAPKTPDLAPTAEPDHPLRRHRPLPSTGHQTHLSTGQFTFSCPVGAGGELAVLVTATHSSRFGTARADVKVSVPATETAPASASSTGASAAQPVANTIRINTDTDGAEWLDVAVGNSALVVAREPLRRLVNTPGDSTDAAVYRLAGLVAGKELLPSLSWPNLGSPRSLHDATRTAVRTLLDGQRSDGGFGGPRTSVNATVALLFAREAGVWVSPRQLDQALRHLHRFEHVVPDADPERGRWIWRAWLARRLAGEEEPEPDRAGGEDLEERAGAFIAAVRAHSDDLESRARVLLRAQNAHGSWGTADLWMTWAWAEFARATPRTEITARVWVGEHGVMDATLRGKRHSFAHVRVPVASLPPNPALTISGPGLWTSAILQTNPRTEQ